MKSLANEFFQTMERGARKHQQAHAADYDLIANGIKDELDVSRQVELVEQISAQRATFICTARTNRSALPVHAMPCSKGWRSSPKIARHKGYCCRRACGPTSP